MSVLLKGMVMGVAVAMPVGPVALVCARRCLQGGIRAGFLTGLGAAAADALYGSVLAFGLVAVSNFILDHQALLYPVGGLLVCLVGYRALRARDDPPGEGRERRGAVASCTATFFLTLSNPGTLFALFAVFAALGLRSALTSPSASWTIVAGVFLGSALWWLLLSSTIRVFLSRLPARFLARASRVQGALLVLFGAAVVCYGLLGGGARTALAG